MYALAAIFLLLSGASGLIYEISWARLLSPHIGSDNAAISIVLSCFFLGITLGSYFSAYVKNSQYTLIKIYLVLEFIIALSAILLIPTISHLSTFIELYPFFAATLFGKFIISIVLLILPTICLGATFPIVSAIVIQHKKEIGLRLGQLYFFNTLGAVIGSLAAGFLLIPSFGLDGAIYSAAMLNVLIIVIAFYFRKPFQKNTSTDPSISVPETKETTTTSSSNTIALWSLSITGFVLLACEVAWSKYLSILTTSSMQSFSVILACTLMGIAVGSWFIRRHINKIKNPVKFLTLSFLIAAFLLMLVRIGFNALPNIMLDINSLNMDLYTKQNIRYLLVAILLFPATFMFGLLFPLCLSLYSDNVNFIKQRIAKAYSINTFAGILGALFAGFWVLPSFGTDTLLLTMIIILLLIPIYVFIQNTNILQRKYLGFALFSIIAISLSTEGMKFEGLISAVDYRYKMNPQKDKTAEYIYIKEGKNSVISLVKYDENYAYLQNNGLQESVIPLNPKSKTLVFESLQAYTPYFLHNNPKSVFVVGYGGGVTTQAMVNTNINSIDVVEIEKNIIEAVQSIPNGHAKALNDPRVNLQIGDARTALLINQKKYDIITSQPSHPWVSGAANLFTKEFFSLVNSRLKDDGIFSQWVALFGMDVTTFKAILKAFYEVFPHGFTMENKESGDMMLIGAKQPILFDYPQIRQRMATPAINQFLNQFHLNDPRSLIWLFSLSRDEIISTTINSDINTDLNILSETHLSSIYANGVGDQDPYQYIKTTASMDILPMLETSEAKFQLFEMGKDFLDWNGAEKAQLVSNQLEKIDSVWGKSLRHEILYWKYDYHQATEHYQSQTNWMDITHYRQFLIYLREKKWDLCKKSIDAIQSDSLHQLAQARLYYKKKEWIALLSLQPMTVMDQRWQFMARLKQNDFSVLKQLSTNTEIKFDNFETLQLISKAYEKQNYAQKNNILIKQITVLTNARLNFYASQLQIAILENNLPWQDILNKETEYLTSLSNTLN